MPLNETIACWYLKKKADFYRYGYTIWGVPKSTKEPPHKLLQAGSGLVPTEQLISFAYNIYLKHSIVTISYAYETLDSVQFFNQLETSSPHKGILDRMAWDSQLNDELILKNLYPIKQSLSQFEIDEKFLAKPTLIFDEAHPLNLFDKNALETGGDELPISKAAYLILYDHWWNSFCNT